MADILESHFYGFEQDYDLILQKMHFLHKQVADKVLPHQLMLLEHSPVITFTRQYLFKSIISSKEDIEKDGIKLIVADRGGDATFHGPGQLVGYPIINLASKDVLSYVRRLEGGLLKACLDLGVKNALTIPGFTGVWIKDHNPFLKLKKLIAIGVGLSEKTTRHGFAFNLSIDHHRFLKHMIPCGLKDKGVTTLKEILKKDGLKMPDYSDILLCINKHLSKTFELSLSGV